MRQQLKLLQAPGASLKPVKLADPIVDARVALWLLNPNVGCYTDSEDLATHKDRVCLSLFPAPCHLDYLTS